MVSAADLLNSYSNTIVCPTKDGCPPGQCPDFTLKRHDTKPVFKVLVEDCDGPFDLADENLIAEVNIWCKAKLKKDISSSDTYFALANDIGFDQVMVGDVIIFDRVRRPEYMLVLGFDENNGLIEVQRAYRGSIASAWKKGSKMRIFRNMNAPAQIEMVLQDHVKEDGTIIKDQIQETYLVYNWNVKDTCTPGCFWLEFKLLRMLPIEALNDSYTVEVNDQAIIDVLANDANPNGQPLSVFSISPPAHGVAEISSDNKIIYTPDTDYVGDDIFTYVVSDGFRKQSATIIVSITPQQVMMMATDDPSNISFTPSTLSATDFGCTLGVGVDWVRKFPVASEGFLIKIIDAAQTEF